LLTIHPLSTQDIADDAVGSDFHSYGRLSYFVTGACRRIPEAPVVSKFDKLRHFRSPA